MLNFNNIGSAMLNNVDRSAPLHAQYIHVLHKFPEVPGVRDRDSNDPSEFSKLSKSSVVIFSSRIKGEG